VGEEVEDRFNLPGLKHTFAVRESGSLSSSNAAVLAAHAGAIAGWDLRSADWSHGR